MSTVFIIDCEPDIRWGLAEDFASANRVILFDRPTFVIEAFEDLARGQVLPDFIICGSYFGSFGVDFPAAVRQMATLFEGVKIAINPTVFSELSEVGSLPGVTIFDCQDSITQLVNWVNSKKIPTRPEVCGVWSRNYDGWSKGIAPWNEGLPPFIASGGAGSIIQSTVLRS